VLREGRRGVLQRRGSVFAAAADDDDENMIAAAAVAADDDENMIAAAAVAVAAAAAAAADDDDDENMIAAAAAAAAAAVDLPSIPRHCLGGQRQGSHRAPLGRTLHTRSPCGVVCTTGQLLRSLAHKEPLWGGL